jgi:Domain of unknown function (DUF697)
MPKKLVSFGSLLVLVCSAIFVVNQTAQVVSLANTISPALGRVVLCVLLTIYAVALLVPVALLIRLPRSMIPPTDEQSPQYQTYLRRLGVRLAGNPLLTCAGSLDDRASVESALNVLDAKADEVVKRAASALFVSTAVSQNGKLDALMVLVAQTRLIWQVAHIYNQRPNPRDLWRLYPDVGAAIFAANAIEDMDIGAQIAPVIQQAALHLSALHAASLVPWVGQAADKMTDIVINAVVDGTANAYLTLRVGIVCRSYCRSITALDRKKARRNVSIVAASMLGSIVSASAASVVKAILAGAMKAGQSGAESAVTRLRRTSSRLNPFKAASDE